ncbi:NAD(P)/FAD-dependent oxidoreductase [Nocardia sp. NBC_01730]|uniref:flavin-containing monooxygenase n=1 Tax=Nocardia sp. NBC_01730 TaxID=2975998 RepID=UPI002E1472CB|nr:NAD(P)/FAD-dependent oxidoreductase [Nocardia sp. NBC_01730]
MSTTPDRRLPAKQTATTPIPDLQVAVVGAGFGGIGMGVALRRAGIHRFAIYEKSTEVGGVWRDNTYPGCNCDVPSHLYSFSFAPYRNRHMRYPGQREILAYLRSVAAEHGLAPHLRLGTAISEATYLEDQGRWELITAAGQRVLADVVIFAVGQLHRPNLPEIPGRADFAGASFHTARWDHETQLHGLDVAMIGTGSTAAQILPTLAATAHRVRVFQRTPHWVLPKPTTEFGSLARAALLLPGAHHLYRQALYHGADTVLAPIMRRGWSARAAEWVARRYLRRTIGDAVLRAKLTPDYPIGGKRIILDSHYYPALTRANVELITDPIARITGDGLVTGDGAHHHADAIICATGFKAPEFLVPVLVRGRGRVQLHEQWQAGATAFIGVAVPGYPNAFLIAGPNSFNPAGSNPAMKERQIDYIIDCLRWRDQTSTAAIEVTERAMRSHQQWLEQAIARTVWPVAGHSWYKHPTGRVTNPWPASARTYERTLRPPPARRQFPRGCGERDDHPDPSGHALHSLHTTGQRLSESLVNVRSKRPVEMSGVRRMSGRYVLLCRATGRHPQKGTRPSISVPFLESLR